MWLSLGIAIFIKMQVNGIFQSILMSLMGIIGSRSHFDLFGVEWCESGWVQYEYADYWINWRYW